MTEVPDEDVVEETTADTTEVTKVKDPANQNRRPLGSRTREETGSR